MASSPAGSVKQIETQVSMILRKVQIHKLNRKEQVILTDLRQSLADARVYTQDYELSEMRNEQVDNAKKAKKYLGQARQLILRASEFNIFGPVDVAHLSAQIDQLQAGLV
jgi:hypothetical protein